LNTGLTEHSWILGVYRPSMVASKRRAYIKPLCRFY
jgi:hypothetical protein